MSKNSKPRNIAQEIRDAEVAGGGQIKRTSFQFSVEKISASQLPSAPDGKLSIRMTLVGFMSQEECDRVTDVWLKKNPVEVLELMSTAGHILTIDFKGDAG